MQGEFNKVLLACWCITTARLFGDEIQVPPAGSAGNTSNAIPFFAGASERYQQVYGASSFGAIAQGGGVITSVAFQFADPNTQGGGVSNVQMNLSTTTRPADGLSATFAQNVGADEA